MADQQSGWTPSHQIATQYATEGLKALVIANGGAVVAILTFAGNASSRVNAAAISDGLLAFAVGLAATLLVFMCSYLAQSHFTEETEEHNRSGDLWRAAGIAFALLGIGAFVIGCFISWRGFKAPVPAPPSVIATSHKSCTDAVDFIRAQADPGAPSAHNPKSKSEAILIRGGWVVLPNCATRP